MKTLTRINRIIIVSHDGRLFLASVRFCWLREHKKSSVRSCTADTPLTQRAPSIFSPLALSCAFAVLRRAGLGGKSVDEDAETRKGRRGVRLYLDPSPPPEEHIAPGTKNHCIMLCSLLLLLHFDDISLRIVLHETKLSLPEFKDQRLFRFWSVCPC